MVDILPNTSPALSTTSDMPGAAIPTEPMVSPPPADTAPPATTTPAAEPTTTTTPTTEPEQPTWTKLRLSEIAAQRRAAEERATRMEAAAEQSAAQVRELLAAVAKLTAAPAPPVTSGTTGDFAEPRPTREAYDTQEAFESELVSWAGRSAAHHASAEMRAAQAESDRLREEDRVRREAADAEAAKKRQEDEYNTQLRTTWDEKRRAAMTAHADYLDIAENPDLPVSAAMGHVIMGHERGPDILYYLGKHPEESAKIAGMIVPGQVFPAGTPLAGSPVPDVIAQAFELGKIASHLNLIAADTAPSPAPTNTLAAPALPAALPTPPTPIAGTGAAAAARDPYNMTMEEYAAHRNEQLAAQRRPTNRRLQ